MITLNLYQQNALADVARGYNIFITGPAGCGKTTFINELSKIYSQSELALTASTGIAAINIKGITLHSWLGIGSGEKPVEMLVAQLSGAKSIHTIKKIRKAKILVIDEISMISADLLNKIDKILRIIRLNDQHFGGLQLIFAGDFMQLPPVSKHPDMIHYCFESEIWRNLQIKIHYFVDIYRQKDNHLINILTEMRYNKISSNSLDLLNSRIGRCNDFNTTYLTTHNKFAEQYNQNNLAKLIEKPQEFSANKWGEKKYIEILQKAILPPETLPLKIGARVMMVNNCYYKDGIINGSAGYVRDFISKGGKLLPFVEFDNGVEKLVSFYEWSLEDYDNEGEIIVKASIMQLPLILAWATTIHKSQGLTIENLYCDLQKIFLPGQAYVAISRATSLEGIKLSNFAPHKLMVSNKVVDFMNTIYDSSQNNF